MNVIVGRKRKIITSIIISIIALLVVGFGLIFGLKGSEFAWGLENLSTESLNEDAKVSMDSKERTITLDNLKSGELSFDVVFKNTTSEDYNYCLGITTELNTLVSSQLQVSITHNGQAKNVYGSSNMESEKSVIEANTEKEILTVTISIPEGVNLDGLGETILKIDPRAASAEESSSDVNYIVVYNNDGFDSAVSAAVQNKTIYVQNKDGNYVINKDIVVNNSLVIYGQTTFDEDGVKVPVFEVAAGKTITVAAGASLELQNVIINGHIQVAEPAQTGGNEGQSATLSSQSQISKLILDNVVVNGSEETITDGTKTDTKPAIVIAEDADFQVVGRVEVYGAAGASAIGVAEDAALHISGDSLYAQGNGGYEWIKNTPNNNWKEENWYWHYNTMFDDPTTAEVDEALVRAKQHLTEISSDKDIANHVTNALSDEDPIKAKYPQQDNGIGGDGIGAIYTGSSLGKLTIANLKSLTAEGYGNRAFGVGGRTQNSIDISNTTIEKARGGLPIMQVAANDSWADGGDEGGAAIGIGNEGAWATTDDNATVALNLNNVIIKAAYGGVKCAAIGGGMYSPVEVRIENCTISNAYGGHSGAAIGGGRYSEVGNQPVEVYIKDSTITDTVGGDLAAGIGSGYTTDERRADRDYSASRQKASMTTINIWGNTTLEVTGGVGGAGIGSGFGTNRVQGKISQTVDTSNVKSGGYGELTLARITNGGKYDTQVGITEVGKYLWSYRIGEIFSRYGYNYYIMNDGETPDPSKAVGNFHGLVSSPEDIGLGSMGGQWTANAASLYADGTVKVVYDSEKDKDVVQNNPSLTEDQIKGIITDYNNSQAAVEGFVPVVYEEGMRLFVVSGIQTSVAEDQF